MSFLTLGQNYVFCICACMCVCVHVCALCACMCVYVCMYVCVCTGSYVDAREWGCMCTREARGFCQVGFSVLYFLFLDKVSHWTWTLLTIELHWLVCEPKDLVSAAHVWGYRHMLPHPAFYVVILTQVLLPMCSAFYWLDHLTSPSSTFFWDRNSHYSTGRPRTCYVASNSNYLRHLRSGITSGSHHTRLWSCQLRGLRNIPSSFFLPSHWLEQCYLDPRSNCSTPTTRLTGHKAFLTCSISGSQLVRWA